MERITRYRVFKDIGDILDNLDWKAEDEALETIKLHFRMAREKYPEGNNFKLELAHDDSDNYCLYVCCQVPETDEEYAERIRNADMLKENRRKQYEALKQEFES